MTTTVINVTKGYLFRDADSAAVVFGIAATYTLLRGWPSVVWHDGQRWLVRRVGDHPGPGWERMGCIACPCPPGWTGAEYRDLYCDDPRGFPEGVDVGAMKRAQLERIYGTARHDALVASERRQDATTGREDESPRMISADELRANLGTPATPRSAPKRGKATPSQPTFEWGDDE